MAGEIYLGPTGTETTLPPLNWTGTTPGNYPESMRRNVEAQTMLDGTIRYNFKESNQRSWSLSWEMLTQTQVETLQGLADLRQTLRFWNGLAVAPAWANVVVSSYSFAPIYWTFRTGTTPRYAAQMTLEEVC